MSDRICMIEPLTHPPDCDVQVPGSKSITNRALLIAALADGESTLDGALFSDDTRYMAEAWQRLGVTVQADAAANRFVVTGGGGVIPAPAADLYVGNAGTAMRFLVAAVCLGRGRFRIDGTPRMRERPIQELVDALGQLGAGVRCESDRGCPPVVIDADGLPGGRATVAAGRSSQFLSALLLIAPYARDGVELEIVGPMIAAPYVDMTSGVMRAFGVTVARTGERRFVVRPQPYAARRYGIEPDASSAHYFLAAAALTGGRVRVQGLGYASLQGDVRFVDLLEQMGAVVLRGDDFLEVRGGAELDGIDADLNAISDTMPTLAALAPFARRPVTIRNVAHVRLQESDRLHAVATELQRLGVRVRELADGLVIEPSAVRPAAVETYDDHRIAMSFALIGLRVSGIGIRDPQCVTKTFPDFFARLEALRR
ncbi:MAG TPA: 3-phosphoshikimate 1-carboxyvinyltransferase [Candidatus Acidoferrales bacterium]|nr:3-phosphoshikimate 1-carboxyvinyltransferase [Candidatus Acidoferrales bacterium]